MYRSLMVPLDGSDLGEQALPLAVGLARRLGAALQVVHVHVADLGVYGPMGGSYNQALDLAMRERDRAYVDAVVQRLATAGDIVPSSALLDGWVPDAIGQHAMNVGADLVVMTTRGRSSLARLWLGSVADRLVRQASIPILLVQPNEDTAEKPEIRRVLIPLDGSELAEQILEPALALDSGVQAEYRLLRVVKQMTPASYDSANKRVSGLRESHMKQLQELDSQCWMEAQQYLERLTERLRARSLTVQTRVVAQEQPAAAILDDAQQHAVDLIALATHGQGGLKRLLLGSVVDKVLRGSTIPILVYRPVETAASK